jgi:exosortase
MSSALTVILTAYGRWLLYAFWIVGSLVVFRAPVVGTIHFASQNDDASHILLIPFVSLFVIWLERQAIFEAPSYCVPVALFLSLMAGSLAAVPIYSHSPWVLDQKLSLFILALVLFWIAGFLLFFGKSAAWTAKFSLLLLLLAVPLPGFLLHATTYFLQRGSAEMVALLFDFAQVPYLREGFIFQLGRFSIEIAEECSGIRSSMAVLILAMLAAHFYIRSFSKQALFLLVSVLIMLIKNGIRIATLTMLALYVNPAFLFGRLHHEGGIVFFLIGMALLFPVLWFLKDSEPLERRIAVESQAEAAPKTE